MKNIVIGIMGPGGNPTDLDLKNAYDIGHFCGQNQLTVLTGGAKVGVMHAALHGAKDAGGQTIAILPSIDKSHASDYADHVIVTGMGSARNNINILSSDIVIACGLQTGTLSEIALALKAGKPVILLTDNEKAQEFLKDLAPQQVLLAKNAAHITQIISKLIAHIR